jgi:AcrR family transcriptional regulator
MLPLSTLDYLAMLTMSTYRGKLGGMARRNAPQPQEPRPIRKRADRYHHGDLRRALLQAAVRTIRHHGVEALTLRGVGSALGVSRTALYRHFADKAALLAAVAAEGFRMLRVALSESWERGGHGRGGFGAMGLAYLQFAVAHQSHYRVMFGADLLGVANVELTEEGAAAFQLLVDAIVALQREQLARRDDPEQMARFVWATVHGVAMLAIDGRLGNDPAAIDSLTRYTSERLQAAIV